MPGLLATLWSAMSSDFTQAVVKVDGELCFCMYVERGTPPKIPLKKLDNSGLYLCIFTALHSIMALFSMPCFDALFLMHCF